MTMRKGFTLIELLVVIAIIGILSTLAIVALGSARQKARDSKRVADISQITKALELYYADNNSYPSMITAGQPLAFGSTTYLAVIPSNPVPRNDNGCPNANYSYGLSGNTNYGYMLGYCLGNPTGSLSSGVNLATAQSAGNDGSLVGWWKMNEGSGATTVADSSTTGSTGTLTNGPAWVSTNPTGTGTSVDFDGTNDYIDAGSNAALKPSYVTVAAWVYYDNTKDNGGIAGRRDNGGAADGYGIAVFGKKAGVWIACGNSSSSTSTIDLPNGQWSHLVGTYDGVRKELYLNGAWISGQTLNGGPIIYQSTPFRIGHNAGGGYFKGKISEVRVYNRALSAGEIKALYDAGH